MGRTCLDTVARNKKQSALGAIDRHGTKTLKVNVHDTYVGSGWQQLEIGDVWIL
ncbi:hypothetical protein IF1G_06098 [Cordyceps javanica]|uniref:Uncharacterized protein n=1 Tax=Cordyceps javanica TaxID=43265 RepID=A0A545V062_9HYPO|nr:hypothetical protein IF1G_06098 [Cordyceps javanica]